MAERRAAGGDDPRHLALALCQLGLTRCLAGLYEESEAAFEESLALARGGGVPEEVASWILRERAHLDRLRGHPAAGEERLREALAIARAAGSTLGELDASHALAIVLEDRGVYGEAIELLEVVLEKRRAIYGDEHRAVAEAHHNLGESLAGIGSFEAAEGHHRRFSSTTSSLSLIHI